MTIDQLKEKARVNNLRRCILRQLILESDFARKGSKFDLLVREFGDCAAVFSKTVPHRQMRRYSITVDKRPIVVIVNLCDSFTQDVWKHSQDHLLLTAEGLFGIDHNLSLSLADGPLLNLVQSLTKVASGFLDLAGDSTRIVSIASFILRSVRLLFSKTFDTMEAVLLMLEGLAYVTDIGNCVQMAQSLAQHCGNVYKWLHNKLVAQIEEIDPIASLATIFCVVFGSSIMKSVPKGSQIDEAVAGSIKFGNLMKGLSGSWAVIERVANFVFGKIFEWHYGIPPHIAELEKCVAGITQWYKDVQQLVSLHTPDQIAIDSQKCAEVETLYSQGVRYSAMIGEFKFDRNILSGFQTHFRVLQACYDRAQSSGAFRGGPRIEPIVIQLHGESGVGKSGMMFPLAIDLLRIDGIPNNDFTQQIYNRNVEQEFWDGYRGQRVTIYDDFGQMRDSQANPNLEFMELIRTGNLAPYPLHMATLEDKAKTYFKSRVVLITSNTAVFRPESLTWPDAVRRRVDLSAQITVKREFAKFDQEARVWRVDPEKVFNLTGKMHSMDVYRVYLCDPQTGHQIDGRPLSYEEFASRAAALYRLRFERSSKLFEFLQERAEAPLAAQLFIPDLEQQGVVEMRDCVTAVRELSMLDFAMICDFGAEQCLSIFDQETRMWLHDIISNVRSGKTSIKDGFTLMQSFAEGASYRRDVEVHVASLLDSPDEDEYLELEPLDRFPCLCHFVECRRTVRSARVRRLQAILTNAKCSLTTSVADAVKKAKEALSKASWYHMAIAGIPLVALVWYFYAKPLKTTFDSITQRKLNKIKPMTIEDVSACIDCLHCGDNHAGVCELSASGDPKTLNFKKPVTELSASADPKTRNLLRPKIELSNSADPKTRIVTRAKVEQEEKPSIYDIVAATDEIPEGDESPSMMENILDAGVIAPVAGVVAYSAYKFLSSKLQAQLQLDPNAFAVSKKVLNNLYEMQLEIDGRWGPKIKICMIRGRVGLTVAHLVPYLKRASRIRLYNKNVPDGHVFPVEKLSYQVVCDVVGKAKDQLLIAFPCALHDHADIVGNIADSVTMSSFRQSQAVLCTPFEGGALMRFGMIQAFDAQEREYEDGERVYTIRDRYEYKSMETDRGDCGSILIGVGSHLPKKILGIHIAGNYGLGVSSPLAVNDILRTLAKLPFVAQIILDVDPYITENLAFDEVKKPEGNFVSVGKSHVTVASPVKTQLRPSLVHGQVVPVSTAPSVLRPVERNGKIIDPMYNGLKKAGAIPPDLNERFLDAAINDMKYIICSNILESDARVLTDAEAVAGIEGDDCLPPIKRSSSAGYPWIKDRRGIGKTKWLGSDEYSLSPDVEFVMRERERLALMGQRYPTFWIDTLKDERRPLSKIEAVKTRVFSAGPMDYTLLFRKYFLGFAAHCCRNRIANEISVGTNVYSHDWTRTVKKCTSRGKKVIAGDFSNFDGTLLLPILYRILDIVDEFYDDGEHNKKIRHVLWKEIINSVHVCGNQVYLWTHSQPSGCPITAILNSIYNSVSMRYCWMVVFKGVPELQSMKMFNKHVAMVSYGDDNVINISDEICESFNQLTIADAYATLGMTYTDEAKSGEMVKYRDIESVAYLKRTFRYSAEELAWIAPLAMETVLEMTNWIRGDLDQEESTIENLETSAFELSLHGREVFEHWIPKYRAATRYFTRAPQFLTYDEYRMSEAVKYGRLNLG
jgi:hypothetical protein